ncbi:MAG: 6-bladed beta-propeller [Phycisphaerae bacterium]
MKLDQTNPRLTPWAEICRPFSATRKRHYVLAVAPVAAALLCLFALTACESPANRPLFSASGPVWPAPPDSPRIRYLGELRGESTLGRQARGTEAIRDLLAGPPPARDFGNPSAVAVSGERVYVTDTAFLKAAALHVIDLTTRRMTSVTQSGSAALQAPVDVVATQNRVVVADSRRAALLVFDRDGEFQREVTGVLSRPAALAVDALTGSIWACDAAAHQILAFDASAGLSARLGTRGAAPGQFNYPAGIAVEHLPVRAAIIGERGRQADLVDQRAGSQPPLSYGRGSGEQAPDPRIVDIARNARVADTEIAVADAMNFRVQLLDTLGASRLTIGKKGDAAGDFSMPRDVAFDSDGHLYVLDNQFENVQVFDSEGRLLLAWGEEGAGPGQFNLPSGITIDDRDRIWIADTHNRRVQVFQYLRREPT